MKVGRYMEWDAILEEEAQWLWGGRARMLIQYYI